MRFSILPLAALCFLALSLSHCANSQNSAQDLGQQILGDWVAAATQISFTSENREGNSRTINVSEGEWETKMRRTPPQMSYFPDHRYTSYYVSLVDFEGRDARDTISQSGNWAVHGDTLIISEPNLSVTESRFLIKLQGDKLELSCTMDMDADGQVDDTYWMMQKRRK